MVEPIKITKRMRESREENVSRITERVNDNIKRAAKVGFHECYFPCDRDDHNDAPFYDEVRKKFEENGYTIKGTGYIGGVLQKTENIMW